MSSPHQVRKAEEKLGLIFGRIGSIRTRLNSLAWQRAALRHARLDNRDRRGYRSRGVLSATPDISYAAAILGLVAIAGVTNSVRAAWRLHVNRAAAASIADRRADLKGRLETIVEIGQRQKVVKLGHSPEHLLLWSYLIEDTLSRQEEFEPARIEARRISRSIYGFLGALVLAARDHSSDRALAWQADSAARQSG